MDVHTHNVDVHTHNVGRPHAHRWTSTRTQVEAHTHQKYIDKNGINTHKVRKKIVSLNHNKRKNPYTQLSYVILLINNVFDAR